MALSEPIIDAPRQQPPLGAPDIPSPARQFPVWPVAILAVPILLRAAIFAFVLLTESWSAGANRIIPAWAQILQASLMGSLAFMLLYYGRADRRAWSLGLFIMDVAATLVAPFVRAIGAPSVIARLGLHVRTDAFQAALLWFFAGVFPRPSGRDRLANVFFAGAAISFVLGLILVTFDTYAQMTAGAPQSLATSIAQSLQRESLRDDDWYFTLQFLLLTPLLVAMPLKLRESGPNDRRRFMWLALGIVVGFLPLAANTILETLWPWYMGNAVPPPYLRLRGALIVVALTVVPIAGAYAALVQRTLDVRLVVHTALQYVLARSFIRALAVAPFIALVALIAFNRERSVVDLVSGPLGMTLAVLALGGCAAALGHRPLRAALDQRFFRQEVDARAMLLSVANAARQAESLDEFRDTLVRALGDAFHPSIVITAVAGADDHLHALDGDLPPLPRGSALAQLLAGSDAPLDVEAHASSIVARLGAGDREWLDLARATVVVPLRGSANVLLGVVALGEKRSELPYTTEDRTLLAAVGACGLALDRILAAARDAQQRGAAALADPAARECVECGTVLDADAIACLCGGLLQRAPVPHTWNDRLRFVQRIGEGGMGVVYRAIDLRLQQLRAVKALPGTDPAMMSRLRREARAMAAVKHHNLATLHELETWRGAPMLVMEFLEGGTLAERLKRGPLPLTETMTLGINLANGLAVLHASGILHRDVKPSNIGFTADGMPKLLDFGLAKLMARTPTASTGRGDTSTWSLSISTGFQGIHGTPAYLSPSVLGGAPPSVGDDLWSLAITLLEACTGSNPFRAPTVAATIARVLTDVPRLADAAAALPDPARQLFADLLGSHAGRPETAQQFAQRLRQCTLNGGSEW